MRRLCISILSSFAFLHLAATTVLSQPPFVDPRRFFNQRIGPPIIVLESYTVRQDLQLSEDQEEKLKRILERVAEAEKKTGDYPGGDFEIQLENERKARRDEQWKKRDEANKEAIALLTEEQRIRVRQIQIWIRQGQALFTMDVCEELKITDDQKDAIVKVFNELRQKTSAIPVPTDGSKEERGRKIKEQIAAVDKEFDEKFLGVLTKEQRAKFDLMRGKKIEVDTAEIPFLSGRRP